MRCNGTVIRALWVQHNELMETHEMGNLIVGGGFQVTGGNLIIEAIMRNDGQCWLNGQCNDVI